MNVTDPWENRLSSRLLLPHSHENTTFTPLPSGRHRGKNEYLKEKERGAEGGLREAKPTAPLCCDDRGSMERHAPQQSLGATGKLSLLAERLRERGLNPGFASKGGSYGEKGQYFWFCREFEERFL